MKLIIQDSIEEIYFQKEAYLIGGVVGTSHNFKHLYSLGFILMQSQRCKNHNSGLVLCIPFITKSIRVRGKIHVRFILEVSHWNIDKVIAYKNV